MATPQKTFELNPHIFSFFELVETDKNDPTIKTYKCKACNKTTKLYSSTTSNLIKHLKTTNFSVHQKAIEQLNKMETESPSRHSESRKRIRLESPKLQSPNLNDLLRMGAVTTKAKYKSNHPRQIEW